MILRLVYICGFKRIDINKSHEILQVAEKLFAENGYNGTSVRQICKEANVNISMISYYFGSKEELYLSIFKVKIDESLSSTHKIIERKDLNAWEKIKLLVRNYSNRIKHNRNFYLIYQREQLSATNDFIRKFLLDTKQNFINAFQEIATQGISSGLFKKQVRIDVVITIISGSLLNAYNSMDMYDALKVVSKSKTSDKFVNQLIMNIETILKPLFGYEENK